MIQDILQIPFLKVPLIHFLIFPLFFFFGQNRVMFFFDSACLPNSKISLFSDWSMICTHHIIDKSENSAGKFKSGSVRPSKKVFVRCPGSSLAFFFKRRRRIFFFCFQSFQRQNNIESIVFDGKSMTTCNILHNNLDWFDMMHLNDFLIIQPYYKILVALDIKAILKT